ncbi:hypothetical protein GJ699_07045 [Duganella sp. FT80W]|uniref:Uncharacterized protein n=1 Tax=Duganella guangzhouensis TaxID=2666084 RepID=A0A6I2KUQ3_9BURK|nr:hypothetical protein [Duganella guangzhouensis]MRW89735.1 hypothetical protein [Duganella guangzhouensis]
MSFVQTIRAGTLPNPTGFGFKTDAWNNAYQVERDGSVRDDHVYLLGLVLGQQAGRIQNSVDHLASQLRFRTIDALVPHFSRRVNEVQRMAFDSWGKAVSEEDAISGERMLELKCFVDAAGNEHALQVPMEATVDSICNSLKLLRHTAGLGKMEAEANEAVDIRAGIDHFMALAQHSLSIQRVWNAVIWWQAEVLVDPNTGNYAVDDSCSDLAQRATVDLVRRPALLARNIENFKKTRDDGHHPGVFLPHITLEDGRLAVRAVPAFQIPEPDRNALLASRSESNILQDAALSGFIQKIHPAVGLSIAEMLVVWGELALMASQLMMLARAREATVGDAELTVILESCLKREEVLDALKRCVQLSADKAAECLDFFCFTAARSATLWDKPLLRSGDDVALLWWPLQGIHHARVLSAWAKADPKLKAAFGKKGTANEKLLEQGMLDAIRRGPYRERIRFVGAGLEPPLKPDEEIDMLIVVDDTAFVIEIASIPSPAEAYEFHDTEGRLEQKAGQCKAKCAVLAEDLSQIDGWDKDRPEGSKINRVFGLVLTNSCLRDGYDSSGLRYSHWDTLLNLIGSGGTYFGVMRGTEEVTLMAPVRIGAGESLADAVIATLTKSPKTEFYTSFLRSAVYKLKGFDSTDFEGTYCACEINVPPQTELEAQLTTCSFADSLVEVDGVD